MTLGITATSRIRMNIFEATAAVVDALEAGTLEYMLVGALSVNAYGIARSTKDADFVVDLRSGDLREIINRLGSEFRLDPQMQVEMYTGSVRSIVHHLPTEFQIELFRLNRNDEH